MSSALVAAVPWRTRRRFKSTAALLRGPMADALGADAAALWRDAAGHLAVVCRHLPPDAHDAGIYQEITGSCAAFLAIWLAARERGMALETYTAMLDTSLRASLSRAPAPLRGLVGRFLHGGVARRWLRSRSGKLLSGFRFELIEGEDPDAFGMNYSACPVRGFCAAAGAPELAPWICELDRAQSELLGFGLRRTGSLSQGARQCDFVFVRGGPTDIAPPG